MSKDTHPGFYSIQSMETVKPNRAASSSPTIPNGDKEATKHRDFKEQRKAILAFDAAEIIGQLISKLDFTKDDIAVGDELYKMKLRLEELSDVWANRRSSYPIGRIKKDR